MYCKKITGLGGIGALNKNTIKAAVRKKFPDVKILKIKHHKFGIFTVRVEKQMPKSVKYGFIEGQVNYNNGLRSIILGKKIDWS